MNQWYPKWDSNCCNPQPPAGYRWDFCTQTMEPDPDYIIVPKNEVEIKDPDKCTCNTRNLMTYGCDCGAFKNEQVQIRKKRKRYRKYT